MSKIILGIHGLGNKPEKKLLEEWWKLSIKEGLRRNGVFFLPFRFKLVYWADLLFEKPLSESGANGLMIKERYFPSTRKYHLEKHPFRKKILDMLEWQMDKLFLNDDLSINYENISNKIIRKYFRELEVYYSENLKDKEGNETLAKEVIRAKLVGSLKKFHRKDILLIGHSMGSIIAYDVLTLILPEQKIDTFMTVGSPLGQAIIIGKNAAEQKVKGFNKKKLSTPPGVEHGWYNFSDLEDIITANYDLADDYEKNENGIAPLDFLVSNDYEINNEENPHKIYGYLRVPELAEKIYEFLLRDRSKVYISFIRIVNKLMTYFLKR